MRSIQQIRGLVAAALVLVSYASCGAAEPPWTALSDGLTAWQSPTGQWFQAGSVGLDPANDRRLAAQPGTGVLVNGRNGSTDNLTSKKQWSDVEVELEFMVPRGSNSGVKLQGVYEIQIADSWKAKPKADGCGGIYPRAEQKPRYHHIDEGTPPRVNACKKPGEWQTLSIRFRSPRFDAQGNKTANARFEKVVLNGQIVHENADVLHPTGHIWQQKEKPQGPLFLQADHGPVAFRNVRIRSLSQ